MGPAGASTRPSERRSERLDDTQAAVVEVVEAAEPLVSLEAVTHRYGRLVALKEVHLSVAPGEFVFVTGPSEAGKTTLLKLIHGDLRPKTGAVRVDGFELDRRWRRFLPRLRRRVAVVFQDHRLLHDMSARGNVAFALQVSDLWLRRRDVRERAQARLDEVGLGRRPGAYPQQLSGGQQRRLAIARALVTDPVLLLADEPTANLDRRNAERVIELLERCCNAGTTVVVATHDQDLVRSRPYRVVELREGRIVSDSPATSPIQSNGAAGARAARRPRPGRFKAALVSLIRLALGYTPPPAPQRSRLRRRAPLAVGTRSARIVRFVLGYRAPISSRVNGAWKPPKAMVSGNGNGSRSAPVAAIVARPPAIAEAWRPPSSVAELAKAEMVRTNGESSERSNGPQNGRSTSNGQALTLRHLRVQAGRLSQKVLGYRPIDHPSRPPRSMPPRRPWVPALNLTRLSFGGALASWIRNFATVAPALGSIAMLLVVAGVLTVGGFALRATLITQSAEASVVHVYLSDDASSTDVDDARAGLAHQAHVLSVTYIDKDQALSRARQMPGLTDLATAADTNPFPASFEVRVNQPSDVAAVAKAAAAEPGVDTKRPTSYDAGTYDRLRRFTVIAAAIAGGFGLLMLVVTYVISSNAIRSAVLARKDELITMQLVGASRWLIRGRLGVEGGLTGGLAGLIAAGVVVGICVVCFFAARHLFVQVLPGVTVSNGVQVVTGIAATGMAIGAVSALFALRRVRM